MWVARDKRDCMLYIHTHKPTRCFTSNEYKTWKNKMFPNEKYALFPIEPIRQSLNKLFENLKWEDEPVEIEFCIKTDLFKSTPIDTIILTRYYKDYDKEHDWFVYMLKNQERYKDYTEEQIEETWKDHIKEEYTIDEIWDTIQCDGYTKIVLRMGRHDIQPDYDYVLETKEYIDNYINN